jgi:hypothetical protein
VSSQRTIERINKIAPDELGRTYGVSMRLDGLRVDCNEYRTTKENAMACLRGMEAAMSPNTQDSAWEWHLEILTFESH